MEFLNKQSNHRRFWVAQLFWVCCLLMPFGVSANGNGPSNLAKPTADVTGCDVITINGGSGSINIQGMSAPIVAVQVFNASWVKVFDCSGNCSVPNQLIPNLPAGTYYVKIDLLNSNWTAICTKESYVTVLGGSSCSNVTSGGTIAGDQTICPNADPAAITSAALPSGGSGQLEYMWLSSTTGCPQLNSNAVAGANAATYDPGVLAQTTWFLRCSRRAGCTDWTVGESNCVKITVDPNANCGGGTGQPNCNTVSIAGGAGNISVSNLIAPVVMVQVFNSAWVQVFSCAGNCQTPNLTIPSLANGQYNVKVSFLNAQWQTVCQKEATVTVGNNAPAATLSVGDVSVNENAGNATVTISLSTPAASPVTVSVVSQNGTAIAGSDFQSVSTTATIAAGATSTTVLVPILDDAVNEPSENFTINLSNATGATIADNSGLITILDNDVVVNPTPSISIGDLLVNENNGTANLTLLLSAASQNTVTVMYATANGTAVLGNDYVATSGTAVFAPGQTSAVVSVTLTDDAVNEPSENFTINLSNATGATIADNSGTVTINDNDQPNTGQPDCNNIVISQNGGGISITGLSAPITMVQAYNASWASVFNQTYMAAPGTVNIPALPNGTYFVKVDFLTSQWAAICKKEQYITLTGTPQPTAPVANNDNATTNSGTSVSISPLANDNLNGGTVQSLQIVSNPFNGTVVVNGNIFQYTPVGNFAGNDQFTYRILGTNGTSNTATVSVNVANAQIAPVANNDNATTNQGTSVSISPLANDNLNGGAVQSLQIVSNPFNGTVVVNGNIFQYTPVANFTGNDQFSYRILGANGTSNTAIVSVVVGQVRDKYRSHNGTANNLSNNKWGSEGIALARELPAEYGSSDPKNALGGQNRPNPRAVSNLIANDPFDLFNDRNLSAMMYTWGQFIDHDMDRTPTGTESAPIALPANEPLFTLPIPFKRSTPLTGTGLTNNREQFNATTAWIDGSHVYGPNLTVANWLRTFSGGKLKVSAGDMLPFNTTTGQFSAPIDPTAPRMDDDQGQTVKVPTTGDPRGNETAPLTALHIVFHREHNRICDRLISQGYTDDETIYQLARKEVGALIQIITYQHWIPSMGIQLSSYTGYSAGVQPDILNSFATAGFRLGHTMVVSDLILTDNNCNPVGPGPFLLTDVFFNPQIIQQYSVDAVLKGISAEVMYEIDTRVNDQLRNFLAGAGAPGLDLASLNIQRGRDHGLPSYNKLRQHYTGTKALLFSDISPVDSVAKALQLLYGSVDNVDAWVGFLAEKHLPNKSVGPTLDAIMRSQFQKLRDGDYYFYQNDPHVTNLATLQATTLKDIIVRNTSLTNLASNVFFANPCPDFCGTVSFKANVGQAQGSNIKIYVNCDATTGRATWTPPVPIVTGATAPDCEVPFLTQNFTPGTDFPIGITTVGYTAYYGTQKVSRTFTVTVEKTAKPKVLFLCNSLSLNSGDNIIKTKLEALGYLVEVLTSLGSGNGYINGHSCVLVSETCNNTHLGWLKSLVLPVVSLKASLLGNLAMSSNYGSNNYWSWDSYHCSIGSFGLWSWLFGGQTGNKKLFDFPFGTSHNVTWGRPNLANCDFQTFVPYSTSDCRTFGYLKGKSMVNGYAAPHHRAAVCLGDNKAQYLNNDGWMHVTNAVKWATDCANWNVNGTDNRAADFSAFKDGTSTNIQWLSNTGDLNDHFVVERSENGLDFYQIATQDGKGAKDELLYFNEIDSKPLEGINYYRLKTMMRDGSSRYSEVKMVEFPVVDGVSVYPNPAREKVFIAFDEEMTLDGRIELVNQMGKTVKTFETPATMRTFEIDLDGIENGFYFLRINLDGKRSIIEKLVVETAK